MNQSDLMEHIESACAAANPFDVLAESARGISREGLSETLLDCGIIPEMIGHDSTPEKLWAKYSDIFLARALTELGIETEVIRVRGNSADVLGRAADYTLVGDAKSFRLSRSAKNQKDFKIKALDDWRRNDTFACLVAPLYQFPVSNSQIYFQAKQKNVTLLSYVHLKFLLDFPPGGSLRPLWLVAGQLQHDEDAATYWQALDGAVLQVTGADADALLEYKARETARTREIGAQGIAYWEETKRRYNQLTREEAIAKVIKAEKIDAKIEVIRRTIAREIML